MKIYLRESYKSYLSIAFGLLIGFIVATFLFDNPDDKNGALAVAILLGLVIGELHYYSRWSKRKKREENI